jgi:hypothetical protein
MRVVNNKMDLVERGWDGAGWTELVWLRIGTSGDSSCERGNEPPSSIKYWESIEWLQNWWPLEQRSAP